MVFVVDALRIVLEAH